MNIINTYHVGYPASDRIPAARGAVLVEEDGQSSVYTGLVHLIPPMSEGDAEVYSLLRAEAARRVATHGMKETYKRAVTYFAAIPQDKYRE